MKKETLSERINKHLCYKNGNVKASYIELLDFLQSSRKTFHYVNQVGRGFNTHYTDYNIPYTLLSIGIDFELKNDSPRGGKLGNYIELTTKGLRQLAKYRKPFAEKRKQDIEKEKENKIKTTLIREKQNILLEEYCKNHPDFVNKLKNRINNYTSKNWRSYICMKVCSKIIENEKFSELKLTASEIRDIILAVK